MEVMPGYIQTEVGVFPSDWPLLALKQISPKQGVGLVINPSTYFNKAGTVPLLVGSNVSENAIDARRANRITELSNELLSASRLSTGDLVTVRVGAPGVTAVVTPDLDGANCASMMIVRRHSSFNSYWLCAAMNSRLGRGQVEHVQYGTAQKQFNISDAVNFKFPVPPRPEQDAIAAVSSDIDALLGALDRLIAKKRDLKQAAMQQLLTGQTRLPGFDEQWKQTQLGDVATFGKGKGLPKSAVSSFGSERCVHYGELFTQYGDTIHETISRTNQPLNHIRSVANDILMPTSDVTPRGLAKASCITISNVVLGGDILIIRANPELIFGTFLSRVIRREEDQVLRLVKGTTVFHLYAADMKKFTFKYPSLTEQRAIVDVLSDMDAELAILASRRAKTAALKQGMMQELLTGRTRLV